MKRPAEHPTKTSRDGDAHVSETITHPAYGMVSACRTSTGGAPNYMFGSDFPHAQTITLRISRAHINRSTLSYDHLVTDAHLIEIEMTEAQFAALSASVGTSGIPCTLRSYRMGGIDGPLGHFPSIASVRQRIAQFAGEMQRVADAIDCKKEAAAETIRNLKGLSKKDRDTLLSHLNGLSRGISDSIPFIAEQFSEHVERELQDLTTNARALQANGLQLENLARVDPGDTSEQPVSIDTAAREALRDFHAPRRLSRRKP